MALKTAVWGFVFKVLDMRHAQKSKILQNPTIAKSLNFSLDTTPNTILSMGFQDIGPLNFCNKNRGFWPKIFDTFLYHIYDQLNGIFLAKSGAMLSLLRPSDFCIFQHTGGKTSTDVLADAAKQAGVSKCPWALW